MTRWAMCPVYVETDSAIKILEIKRPHQVKLLGISFKLLYIVAWHVKNLIEWEFKS